MCVLKEYTIQIDAFLGLTMEVEIVPERVKCSHIDASGLQCSEFTVSFLQLLV